MMDVSAAARGPGEAARPAAPGAPGHGIGEGRERAAERGFAALVDGAERTGPEEALPGVASEEPETEPAVPEPPAAVLAGPGVPLAQPDGGLSGPGAIGMPTGETSGETDLGPDGSDRIAADPEVAEPGEEGSGPDASEGLAEPSWRAGDVLTVPVGPEHRAGAGPGESHGPALARPGPAGPSRAEWVLAALVAAQAPGGPPAGEPNGAGADLLPGPKDEGTFPTPPLSSAAGDASVPMAARAATIARGREAAAAFPGSGSGRDQAGTGGEDLAGGLRPEAAVAPGAGGVASGRSALTPRDDARRPAAPSAGGAGSTAETGGVRSRAGAAMGRPDLAAKASPLGYDRERSPGPDQPWPGDRAFPFAPAPLEAGGVSGPSDGPQATRHIARQVADHPVLRTGGAAEMTLNPEELGHLRLTVEGSEGALRIVIEAARPETADLLRRHVETLRQELRQEGLGSVGVSIGGGDAHQGGESAPRGGQVLAERPGPAFVAAVPAASPSLPALRERTPAGQLDLRF